MAAVDQHPTERHAGGAEHDPPKGTRDVEQTCYRVIGSDEDQLVVPTGDQTTRHGACLAPTADATITKEQRGELAQTPCRPALRWAGAGGDST